MGLTWGASPRGTPRRVLSGGWGSRHASKTKPVLPKLSVTVTRAGYRSRKVSQKWNKGPGANLGCCGALGTWRQDRTAGRDAGGVRGGVPGHVLGGFAWPTAIPRGLVPKPWPPWSGDRVPAASLLPWRGCRLRLLAGLSLLGLRRGSRPSTIDSFQANGEKSSALWLFKAAGSGLPVRLEDAA